MNDDVVKKLEYWAFKLCGKGEQEDAASDVMSEALKEIIKLRDETERLTRERDEARAEVERLREALRDALDGLRYWVPQTSVGAVEKCRIVEKGIEALEAKP